LGFPEQAARAAKKSLDEAAALKHPNSLCYAVTVARCPVALLIGDLATAEQGIAMLLDQSTRHQMALWRIWATGYKGALYVRRGDHDVGLQLLSSALNEFREKRYFVPVLGFLCELAQAFGRAGRAPDGLASIREALDQADRTDEHWCLAELLRIKGELLLLEGSHEAIPVAEDLFAKSIALAQRQEVRSWTLRTTISLARLRRAQGRPQEARDLLNPVYGRFTEGFETADLRTAQRLIVEPH
jgi:predicted ATPase